MSPRRHRSVGQSLAEFALVVPVMLTAVGGVLDLSRVYQAWINLESATRDAAQYVASDPGYSTTGGYFDPTDTANYCATPPITTPCTGITTTDAKTVVDREVGVSFTTTSSQATCDTPSVWAALTASTSASNGGSESHPASTVTVTTCMRFRALFAYPFFTQGGDWLLRVSRTYTVLIGR